MAYQTFPTLLVLGLSLAAAAAADNGTGTSVTCTVVRDDASESARVMCHFSSDVSSTLPVSLSVDFYPEGKTSPVSLIDCDWETLNDSCQIQKGRYSFSQSPAAASDMILGIANVTKNDTGRYVCQMLSKDKSDTSAPCKLTVKDRPAGKTTNDATTLSDDGGKTVEEAGSNTTVIVVAVLVAVAILITVAIAVFLCRRRRRAERSHELKKPDEEKALSEETPEGHPLQDTPESAGKPDAKDIDFGGIPGNDTPNMGEKHENKAPDSPENPKPGTPNAVVESPEHEASKATGSPDQELPNAMEGAEPREGDRLLGVVKEGSGDERKPNPPAE